MKLEDIPVVILAGGRGARFDSESQVKPKPMIEVAGKPMLQHVIDGLVLQGFRQFFVATGYLGNVIDEYFQERCVTRWDDGRYLFHVPEGELNKTATWGSHFAITSVDTGESSHTGERLYKLRNHINGRRFILTYADGFSDVKMVDVIAMHESFPGTHITVTAVNPPGRFGVLELDGNHVRSFDEKPSGQWINGGFMVIEPEFIDKYITRNSGVARLEAEGMSTAAAYGRMMVYKHSNFWKCVDTRRDLEEIEKIISEKETNDQEKV